LSVGTAGSDGYGPTFGLLDVGVLAGTIPGVTAALAAQNLAAHNILGKQPPTVVRAGTAVRLANTDLRFDDPMWDPIVAGLLVSLEIDFVTRIKSGMAALGLEYRWGPWAYRFGYGGGASDVREGRKMTIGLGRAVRDWSFDASLAPAQGYGNAFRFGLTRKFGTASERAAADAVLSLKGREEEEPGVEGSVHLVERRFQRAETALAQ